MILCLLHATDIYQIFLKILLINTSLFSRKMLKKEKNMNILVIFGSKRKTGKCQKHETNMILCLLHATYIYQFHFENFTHKPFTFFKKSVETKKKSEHFGNFWFKKKTGKCQKHETNMILCLLHATDIYQFFLKILLINISLFSRKMLKKRKKKNILV